MQKSEKSFDTVQRMRKIRDKLSDRFKNMSFEEQKRYMREHITGKPAKDQSRAGVQAIPTET